jgi:hypothetical protein
MTIGTIVHEVLQVVLRKKLHTLPAIKNEVESLLNSSQLIRMLYACEMSMDDIRTELKLFIDKIFKFVLRYMRKGSGFKVNIFVIFNQSKLINVCFCFRMTTMLDKLMKFKILKKTFGVRIWE